MGILGEHGDHRSAGLLQSHRYGPAAELLGQFGSPNLDRLGRIVELAMCQFPVGCAHAPEVFLIGPVQTDPRCVKLGLCFCIVARGHSFFTSIG
jgi:hypothetical protein